MDPNDQRTTGGIVGKLAGSVVLFLAVVALLFFVVFPWAEPRLPWNHVNIDGSTGPAPTPTATASATAGR
jgi:hypothetical protein